MMLQLTSAKHLLLDLSLLGVHRKDTLTWKILSEVEKEVFNCTDIKLGYSNFSIEERKAMSFFSR